jgi:hypothetical protein
MEPRAETVAKLVREKAPDLDVRLMDYGYAVAVCGDVGGKQRAFCTPFVRDGRKNYEAFWRVSSDEEVANDLIRHVRNPLPTR